MSEEVATDVTHDANLRPAGLYWDRDSDPLESFEDDAWPPLGGTGDAGVRGVADNDFSLDFLGDEESLDGALEGLEELARAAQSALSKPGGRGSAKALGNITAEDFREGPEQSAFILIMSHARTIFKNKSPRPEQLIEALRFFFGELDDEDGVRKKSVERASFDLCCAVLQARPDVLRLRMQYEWWLRLTVFKGPFPFKPTQLPEIVLDSIAYYAPSGGIALASVMWAQPGISTQELLDETQRRTGLLPAVIENALERLAARYLISPQVDTWYLTGRNPLLAEMAREGTWGPAGGVRRSTTVHWSALFGESR